MARLDEKNPPFVFCKLHTIRSGFRFKVGEKFSPREWEGLPYRSKQIILAPDIEIKKIFNFEISISAEHLTVMIDDLIVYCSLNPQAYQYDLLTGLVLNDGLMLHDFRDWFKWGKQNFKGQIICWHNHVEYKIYGRPNN